MLRPQKRRCEGNTDVGKEKCAERVPASMRESETPKVSIRPQSGQPRLRYVAPISRAPSRDGKRGAIRRRSDKRSRTHCAGDRFGTGRVVRKHPAYSLHCRSPEKKAALRRRWRIMSLGERIHTLISICPAGWVDVRPSLHALPSASFSCGPSSPDGPRQSCACRVASSA